MKVLTTSKEMKCWCLM